MLNWSKQYRKKNADSTVNATPLAKCSKKDCFPSLRHLATSSATGASAALPETVYGPFLRKRSDVGC